MALRSTACAILLVTTASSGCHPTRSGVQADLGAYIAKLGQWQPVEAASSSAIARILRTQFVDEAEVRRQIGEDAPRVQAHLKDVRAYEPATRDVRAIHARYVSAWVTLRKGYGDLLRGLDTGDASSLAAGRSALEEWRRLILETAADVRRLSGGQTAGMPPGP